MSVSVEQEPCTVLRQSFVESQNGVGAMLVSGRVILLLEEILHQVLSPIIPSFARFLIHDRWLTLGFLKHQHCIMGIWLRLKVVPVVPISPLPVGVLPHFFAWTLKGTTPH